jgi:hypothetical protein
MDTTQQPINEQKDENKETTDSLSFKDKLNEANNRIKELEIYKMENESESLRKKLFNTYSLNDKDQNNIKNLISKYQIKDQEEFIGYYYKTFVKPILKNEEIDSYLNIENTNNNSNKGMYSVLSKLMHKRR